MSRKNPCISCPMGLLCLAVETDVFRCAHCGRVYIEVIPMTDEHAEYLEKPWSEVCPRAKEFDKCKARFASRVICDSNQCLARENNLKRAENMAFREQWARSIQAPQDHDWAHKILNGRPATKKEGE